MIDIAGLEQSVSGNLARLHNWAKNVETAHLGQYYTTVIDNLDYYIVECVAKPTLNKAPDWVSDNKAVSFIKDYKGLIIVTTTVALAIFILVMLHPKGPAKQDPSSEPKPITPRNPENDGGSSPRANGGSTEAGATGKGSTSEKPNQSEIQDPLGHHVEEDDDQKGGTPKDSPRSNSQQGAGNTQTSVKSSAVKDPAEALAAGQVDKGSTGDADSTTATTLEGKPRKRASSSPTTSPKVPKDNVDGKGGALSSSSTSIPFDAKTHVALSANEESKSDSEESQ